MVTITIFRVCGLGDSSVKYGLLSSGNHSKLMVSSRPTSVDIKQS